MTAGVDRQGRLGDIEHDVEGMSGESRAVHSVNGAEGEKTLGHVCQRGTV